MTMGFNKEQAMAISAGIDEDILISAGAGSGKTKTLSERVYRIISDPSIGLKPSELLVLTFTNNAAHEMKTRIVARFASEGKEKEALAAEMQSAHIQTFDSFNGDLVRAYSDRLGLPDSFMVADESVLAVKENDILDSVLKRRYDNPEKREIMASLIERFSWKNDKPLRQWLLGIYHEVAKFVPAKKRRFYERYEEDFLTDEFLAYAYRDFIKEAKTSLLEVLCKAHFEGEVARGIASETLLSDPAFWQEDPHSYQYEDSAYAMPAHQAILNLIDTPEDSFLDEARAFGDANKKLFPTRSSRPGVAKEEKERLDAAWKELKKAYGRKDSIINALALCPTLNETKVIWEKDRPLYVLVLEILREFNEQMIQSKKAMASFTFEDISSFALELLTAPEYEDIAEEVRTRFRYIMVDEYQDTNDAQEVFLESLLKTNRKGTRAHLFCVGDSKQSIYAFRNSNVELFKDRQKRYLDGKGHRVIAMNKNYRSGPGLLSHLNVVFEKYMRLSHGGVDYSDPMERLAYDEQVNLYSEPYADFGIQEIFLENGNYTAAQEVALEAQAILSDIQKKVANGYLVYDRSSNPHIRPCRYSDFVILMRKKTHFGLYQRLFNRAGVKLNNLLSDNLREIDPITVLQSLFGLLCYFYGDHSIDAAHLFVSVARSYIGNRSDEEIYSLLAAREKTKVLEALAKDPLWRKIEAFAVAHKDGSFRSVFLDLLSDFGVIEKLNHVGTVGDLISKIDSLYALISEEESIGEGLESFVKLMSSMSKYDLPYRADTIVRSENAVDLMTIHASKGLEQKVVYLPASCNELAKTPVSKGPKPFSPRFGFALPKEFDLSFFEDEDNPRLDVNQSIVENRILSEGRNNAEVDEHVRLYYVALTRAENTVIFVGNPFRQFQKAEKENLHSLLSGCGPLLEINPSYLEKMVAEGVLKKADLLRYKACLMRENASTPPLFCSELQPFARAIFDEKKKRHDVFDPHQENLEAVREVENILLNHYLELLSERGEDPDLLACLSYEWTSGAVSGRGRVQNAQDYSRFLSTFESPQKEEENQDVDEGETEESADMGSEEALSPAASQDIATTLKGAMAKEPEKALATLAYVFDGERDPLGITYQSDDLSIKTCFYHAEEGVFGLAATTFEPKPEKVDDTILEFPVRVKERASKQPVVEEDPAMTAALDRGVALHRYMELLDFKTLDLSYMQDPRDRRLMERVVSIPVMAEAKGANVYPEYGYYDTQLETSGFIDLLYEKDGKYVIVDYKSSHIDDPAYDRQLHTYARNVSRIFGVKEEEIRLYLVSIAKATYREVR